MSLDFLATTDFLVI